MAEAKKTRGTAAKRATKNSQKAITEAEVKANDKVIGAEVEPTLKRNVVGSGVADGSVSTPTQDDEVALLKKKIAELETQNELLKNNQGTPSVIQVSTTQEKVCFLWQAEVADDNTVEFGGDGRSFGKVTGKTGTIFVPKNEISMFLDTKTRLYIQKRWLIALSGLTEDEKEALGMDYEDGEILDKGAFAKLVEMGDEILEIFPKLCDSHKEIVAKRYYEDWSSNNPTVKRETVVALNSICKKECPEIGAFAKIIEEMNEADLDK